MEVPADARLNLLRRWCALLWRRVLELRTRQGARDPELILDARPPRHTLRVRAVSQAQAVDAARVATADITDGIPETLYLPAARVLLAVSGLGGEPVAAWHGATGMPFTVCVRAPPGLPAGLGEDPGRCDTLLVGGEMLWVCRHADHDAARYRGVELRASPQGLRRLCLRILEDKRADLGAHARRTRPSVQTVHGPREPSPVGK